MQVNITTKKKIRDLILNICATVIMNCVLQFLCYPMFEEKLGEEVNGIVLSLISVISITAGTLGSASNYSRLVNENVSHPSNGDYNVIVLIGGLICSVIGIIYLWINHLLSPLAAILYSVLILLTAIRYYADVEFKLNTNFIGYFIFYLFISIGYFLGIILFNFVGLWYIAIILGELCGVVYAFFACKIFKTDLKISKSFKIVLKSVAFLLLSSFIENLTLNADRLVLLAICGGTSVTYYYVASLFGKVIALLTVPINSLVISYLIKYDGNLTKKIWITAIGASLVLGLLAIIGCFVGSIIIIPLLYDCFEIIKPILIPAICAQVFFFISSVLLVILLRFYGEKKQFALNLIYGVIFFITTIIFTKVYGLNGFVYSSLMVNIVRFAITVVFGFFAEKKSKTAE